MDFSGYTYISEQNDKLNPEFLVFGGFLIMTAKTSFDHKCYIPFFQMLNLIKWASIHELTLVNK